MKGLSLITTAGFLISNPGSGLHLYVKASLFGGTATRGGDRLQDQPVYRREAFWQQLDISFLTSKLDSLSLKRLITKDKLYFSVCSEYVTESAEFISQCVLNMSRSLPSLFLSVF